LKKVEIVIVDDGSKDKTHDLIINYTKKHTTDKNITVRGIQLK
jgi:glycosyltransferase involved in cell wall biosynthesis